MDINEEKVKAQRISALIMKPITKGELGKVIRCFRKLMKAYGSLITS